MKKQKKKYIKNEEMLAKDLKKILKEVYQTENPEEITEYKIFFKKHVNIFARTYVSAYLIKRYIASKVYNPNHTNSFEKTKKKIPQQNKKYTSPPTNTFSHLQKNTTNKNKKASNTSSSSHMRNQRLSLPIGKENTTKEELLNFFATNGIEKSSISQIKVLHKNSLVYIQSNKILQFTKNINGKTFKKILIKIKNNSSYYK